MFYYKTKLKIVPKYFQIQLPQNTQLHSHLKRNNENLHIFNSTSELRQQLINVKISNIWNTLPQHLKHINPSQKCFNQKVKYHYISQYNSICSIPNCYICQNSWYAYCVIIYIFFIFLYLFIIILKNLIC